MDSNELLLKEENGTGDSLEARIIGGEMCLELDEPWAGDTQNGFGRSSYFTLTKGQAKQLGEFLLGWSQA